MNVDPLIKKSLTTSNTIRELYLYQIPLLKQCKNWNLVKEIALINFQGKHYHYDGGIVILEDKYYFLSQSLIQNLNPYRKWKFEQRITVLNEPQKKQSFLNKKEN